MPQRNETLAEKKNKSKKDESEVTPIDLYIGIFFDGTNNNKYQVMLGKLYRRKEIFEKAKERLKEKVNNYLFLRDFNKFDDRHSSTKVQDIFNLPNLSKRESWETNGSNEGVLSEGELNFIYGRNRNTIRSVNDVLRLSRKEIETNYSGVFTKSELEYLYFGYGNINDSSDNSFDTFVEKKSYSALGGEAPNHLSAKPDDAVERGTLRRTAGNAALLQDTTDEDDAKRLEDYKGASAQGTTYTNVAILESLYKCENKSNNNNEIIEKHISIYIEGSGTDMQLEAKPFLIKFAGLALGTGPSGVAAKVRKASIIVQRLLDQHIIDNVKEINFHFDLYGFSRGSTCARVMAYVINPTKEEKYRIDNDKNKKAKYKLFTSKESVFLPSEYGGKTLTKEIRFMGLFDTVSSIGIIDKDHLLYILARIIENRVNGENKLFRKDIPTLWKHIKSSILPVCTSFGSIIDDSIGRFVGEKVGEYVTYKADEKIDPIIEEIKNHAKTKKHPHADKNTDDVLVIPEGNSFYHKDNVNDYGLWATKLANDVVHICAMDEFRRNFALVDIQSCIDKGNGTEIFIPGCHTDIGGGASIGMDSVKIVRTSEDRFIPSFHMHKKADLTTVLNESKQNTTNGKDQSVSTIMPMTVDTLKTTGWLSKDSMNKEERTTGDETYYIKHKDFVKLYRFVTPGYSNVSLYYLYSRSKDNFNPIPKSYHVPSDLEDLLNQMSSICTAKKRYFLYPRNSQQYYELRRKYLHLSFNELDLGRTSLSLVSDYDLSINKNSILSHAADNMLVNGPEYTEIKQGTGKKVISRIIYSGVYQENDDSGETRKHMFDYDESEPTQPEPVQPRSGLHPLLSEDSTGFQEYDTSNDRIFISFPDRYNKH